MTPAEEIQALQQQLNDLNTVAVFWRQAAEHAVTGWNALEDKYEALLVWVRDAKHIHDQIASRLDIIVDDRVEWAPPEPMTPLTSERVRNFDDTHTLIDEVVDLGDGKKLRVVEEETNVR